MIDIQAILRGPYRSVIGRGAFAATAGVYSYAVARPGVGVLLQIRKVLIKNSTAAPIGVDLRALNDTDITTIAPNFNATPGYFWDASSRAPRVSVSGRQQVASRLTGAFHAATHGLAVGSLEVPANDTLVVPLTDAADDLGVLLWGLSGGTAETEARNGAFAAVGDTVNEMLVVAMIGREYPLSDQMAASANLL